MSRKNYFIFQYLSDITFDFMFGAIALKPHCVKSFVSVIKQITKFFEFTLVKTNGFDYKKDWRTVSKGSIVLR